MTKDLSKKPGRLCWAGYVTGKAHVEVMVRRVDGLVDPYVLYLDNVRESAHHTPQDAMTASKLFGYENHGPTLESSLGG